MRLFYRWEAAYIPVLSTGEDGSPVLVCFLDKGLVEHELAALNRADELYDTIPQHLTVKSIPRKAAIALVDAFENEIPCIDKLGRILDPVEPFAFLNLYDEQEKESSSENEKDESDSGRAPESSDQWFAKLLLGAVPEPMYAADLEGKSFFYNQPFIERVLRRSPFNGVIALAESYFLNLTRDQLAKVYSSGPHPADLLLAAIPELGMSVEICPIDDEKRSEQVMGYLYIFRDPATGGLADEITARLQRGLGLDDILEEIEAGIIVNMLKQMGENVSHAAEALRVNRSTLQNKIKRLKINSRFDRKIMHPIRRIRSVKERSSLKEDARVESVSLPQTDSTHPVKKADTKSPPPVRTAAKKPSSKAARKPSKKKASAAAKKAAKKKTKKASKKTGKK